jgi:uncharacterized protein
MVQQIQIELPMQAIEEFCKRWAIREFALFGSVLRDDFRPDSDIDVLVSFDPSAEWGLFALGGMQQELAQLFGRPVDVIVRKAVEQGRVGDRRREILDTARVVSAASGTISQTFSKRLTSSSHTLQGSVKGHLEATLKRATR